MSLFNVIKNVKFLENWNHKYIYLETQDLVKHKSVAEVATLGFSSSERRHVHLPIYGSSEWNPDGDGLQDVLQKCREGKF